MEEEEEEEEEEEDENFFLTSGMPLADMEEVKAAVELATTSVPDTTRHGIVDR